MTERKYDLASFFCAQSLNRDDWHDVNALFEAMGLPLPRDGEFTVTAEDSMKVFLNDIGCVLQIGPRTKAAYPYAQSNVKEKLSRSQHVLQPIGEYEGKNIRLQIFPAVVCPVSAEDIEKLRYSLAQDGLSMWDDKRLNAGYLPSIDGEDKIPVLIDMGAVSSLSSSTTDIKDSYLDDQDFRLPGIFGLASAIYDTVKTLTGNRPVLTSGQEDPQPLQQQLYGRLKDAFAAAWPDGSDLPDTYKMMGFWDKCRSYKERGLLVTSWQTPEYKEFSSSYGFVPSPNYKNVIEGSSAYEQRRAAISL